MDRTVDVTDGALALIRRAERADDVAVFGAHPINKCLTRGNGRIKENAFRGGADRSGGGAVIGGVAEDPVERRTANCGPADSHFGYVGIVRGRNLGGRGKR